MQDIEVQVGGAAGWVVQNTVVQVGRSSRQLQDTLVQVACDSGWGVQDTFVQVGGIAERVLQVTVVQVGGAAGRWCKTLRCRSAVQKVGCCNLQDTVVQQEDWCMTPNDTHLMLYFITFSTEHSELC